MYYVKDCTVDVPVPVTFRIASELQDNIANAIATGAAQGHRQRPPPDPGADPIPRAFSLPPRRHQGDPGLGERHQEGFEPDVANERRADLRTGTRHPGAGRPPRRVLGARARYRTASDVHEWEKLDSPLIKKEMEGLHVWVAEAFPILPLALGPVTRPTITFPPAGPRRNSHGSDRSNVRRGRRVGGEPGRGSDAMGGRPVGRPGVGRRDEIP